MPPLGDYLGHLLAEITIARLHASAETLRIGELFASQTNLRSMPIPHLKIMEIDLDMPVAIEEVEEGKAGEPLRGGTSRKDMLKSFDTVLDKTLGRHDVKLTQTQKKKVKSAMGKKMEEVAPSFEVAGDVSHMADALAKEAAKMMDEFKKTDQIEGTEEPPAKGKPSRFELEMDKGARTEFLKLRGAPPRINVLVTSQDLREAGPETLITRIKMKITEESYEWAQTETDEGLRDRLVPE
jgi:hypothetical protein